MGEEGEHGWWTRRQPVTGAVEGCFGWASEEAVEDDEDEEDEDEESLVSC